MTNRITDKHLEAITLRINKATGSPIEPYTRTEGRAVANVGNYHISHAYGGVSLHRMHNEGGGVSDVFSCGHIPKRELADRMYALLVGLEIAADKNA